MQIQMTIVFGKIKITNPAEKKDIIDKGSDVYTGDIDNFIFPSPYYANRFQEIQNLLPDEHKLKIIFSSRLKREGKGKKGGNYWEFVACSEDNKFMWRKYDSYTTSQVGQSWVYCNGTQYKTTEFVDKPEEILQKHF